MTSRKKGLGSLSVKILIEVAKTLKSDAIELTTATNNEGGWNTYLKAGFEYTGIIRNPLEVDVTDAIAGIVNPMKYRDERQMVYVINTIKRKKILNYLEIKRLDSYK